MASVIMRCGEGKVWIDPNEFTRISNASSREQVRDLIKDGFIIQKPQVVHSRFRARERQKEKAKGRHMGIGKRKGTANARAPVKEIWMKKMRIMRKILREMRKSGKITPTEYRKYYLQVKGNTFKSQKILVESIERQKLEEVKMKELSEQAQALKMK
ncbi:ribosomal protein L19 [Hamiltosporidium tvaerminnensis]|uniref:Ribosomal protein L19 n=1 Tax=Hamiltosporidium tvaerminnensis TaxID=1176355 RepID=A0A4Q9LM71_9MICR|nr:ribosomal protein L19 [Hamiltosporidium tvaerminnensis]